MMQQLNLPDYEPRLREREDGKSEIFDPVRKKYVRLTPEEWVRQHFVNLMVTRLGFPASLIVVEAELTYNRMKKRFDILAYTPGGMPALVIECKSPRVEITQDVFDQVAMYNMTLRVGYLVVTNGMTHYACRIDHEKRSYTFLREIPEFRMVNAEPPGSVN